MHLTSVKVYISFRPRDNWTNENHINYLCQFYFCISHRKNFLFFNSRIGGGSGKKETRKPECPDSNKLLVLGIPSCNLDYSRCSNCRDKKRKEQTEIRFWQLQHNLTLGFCVALCIPKGIKQNRLIQSQKNPPFS